MASLSKQIEQVIKSQADQIRKVDNAINVLPDGSLYCNKKRTCAYYYHCKYSEGKRNQIYIGNASGKHAQLISDLKRKRFLLGCKKVLEGNVVALRACLLKYNEFDPSQISSRLAATYENIKDAARPQQDQLTQQDQQSKKNHQDRLASDWQHAPYPRAEMYEEGLKHEAIGGLWVRSKSEALLAFALDLAHIPFHYEEILELDDKKIAPDFTILHPVTGEKVYWEHFGKMDDSVYATETFKKLVLYGQNGILPGKNLIYTMETIAEPLSIREIQGMIMHYLLS
jgi:hypothetical protein